jgi:hypothetical protein
MLANDETPGLMHEAAGEDVPLTCTPIYGKLKKTHNELHEEVLMAGALLKEFDEQVIDQPLGGYQGRSRVRSGTVRAHFPFLQTIPSTRGPQHPVPPPVPPLPVLNQASPRATSPNMETQATQERRGSARDPPTDRPISHSHVALNSRSSPTDDGGLMAQSNSPTTASSSPRRDHGHLKQSHRPRDSLVLEKARLIEQFHSLRKITILPCRRSPDFR